MAAKRTAHCGTSNALSAALPVGPPPPPTCPAAAASAAPPRDPPTRRVMPRVPRTAAAGVREVGVRVGGATARRLLAGHNDQRWGGRAGGRRRGVSAVRADSPTVAGASG